eukprot:TRINITY_DN45509_c0_g1_i1.p1 TRINITY_DN45509_c0_g1~~TRINITY_DN45509_c0_g1_i1.p1  ORF type:complete len:865 (-),score=178.93 TRINITY_DN45509_c0_g1_i1:319-2913(-)
MSLRSLVRALVRSELKLDQDQEDARGLESLAIDVFNSLSASGRSQRGPSEEAAVDDLIARHLLQGRRKDSRGLDRHLRFHGLRKRMQEQPVLRNSGSRCAVLQLLYSLRGRNDGESEPGFTKNGPHDVRRVPRFDMAASSMPLSEAAAPGPRAETEAVSAGLYVGRAGPPAQLSEGRLVRDLLFALQGVNSDCFTRANHGFETDSACILSRPAWMLSQRILELANLHLKLTACVNSILQVEGKRGKEELPGSLLGQALCEALRDQLREYYKTLALLMSKTASVGDEKSLNASSDLSLRRLWSWLQGPRSRLQLLASLTEACRGLMGGALASTVHGFGHVGDALAQEACMQILRRVVSPLLAMIRAWMTEGELQDPFGEFFVCADSSVPLDDLWKRMYSLEIEMVPSFLTLDLSRKILLTGKSVNFIRLCCPGQNWFQTDSRGFSPGSFLSLPSDPHEQDDLRPQAEDGSPLPGSMLLANLSKQVESAAEKMNKHLVKLMMDQYALMEHSLALRRFLLLGQGDFVESLMDGAQEELIRDAAKIHKHHLMGILDMALRQSNAQFCPSDVLARLGVKLLSPSSGECGWDIFLLDYAIDSPLHVVFTPAAMQKYDRAFQFLWKLRRVSHALASCWNQHMSLQRHLVSRSRLFSSAAATGMVGVPELRLEMRQTLHKCTCLRNEMHHFVQNIQSYVMCEVLETSWAQLQSGWQACTDLDQVILEHQRYLSRLEEGAFLAPGSEAVLSGLTALLGLALDFCGLQEQACAASFEAVEAMDEEQVSDEEGSAGFRRPRPAPYARSLAECRAQLGQLGDSFVVKLQVLLRALEEQPALRYLSSDLSFLLCSLDFNAYYEQKRKGPIDERVRLS